MNMVCATHVVSSAASSDASALNAVLTLAGEAYEILAIRSGLNTMLARRTKDVEVLNQTAPRAS
jgi:hypothetical protein